MGLLLLLAVVLSSLVAVVVSIGIAYRDRSAQQRRERELDYEHNPPHGLDHGYIEWMERREREARERDQDDD